MAAACLPPLVAAWRAIPRAGRLWRYVALLLTPMVVTGLLHFVIGNRLLAQGVLADG